MPSPIADACPSSWPPCLVACLRLAPAAPDSHRSRRRLHRRRARARDGRRTLTSRRQAPPDELDSLATWPAEDGRTWLIATGKSSHRLVGVRRRHRRARCAPSAAKAAAPGQFNRPNGIAVYRRPPVRGRARQPPRAGAAAARLHARRHLRREGTAQPLRPVAAPRPSRASWRSTSPTASCTARSSTKCRRWHELDQRVRRYRVQFDQDGRLRAQLRRRVRRHHARPARCAWSNRSPAIRAQRPPADRRRGSPPRIHAARVQLLRPATPAAACRRTASAPKPRAWRCGPARTAAVTGSRSTSSRR